MYATGITRKLNTPKIPVKMSADGRKRLLVKNLLTTGSLSGHQFSVI